ncbi:MAG: HAD hydrolase-like protein [Spirochaetales bacterium]|nr:HAD hydrolase-like protein [Spirochaetales bacterium]
MKYKAVFFDLDGTLMDTSDGIFAGGRYAMEKVGIPIPEVKDWDVFIGPPLGDCFRQTFGITDEDKVRRLCEAYHDFYMREGRLRAHFYPGILDVVGQLKARGYILGIASMKNEDLVQQMCRDFKVSDLFDVQLGIDLVGTMTKGDLLKDGFARLGLRPEECVLVGDTSIDEKGARDAGCDCIRADWGFGFKRGTPGTISSPYDILDLV